MPNGFESRAAEDIETSYWDAPNPTPLYGTYPIHAGAGTHGSAIEKLKQLVDVINRRFQLDSDLSVLGRSGLPPGRYADHELATITFARNAVILTKKKSALWAIVDRKVDARTAEPYRPFGVHDAKRVRHKRHKANSAWMVEGTPKTIAAAWASNITEFDALLCS